MVTLVERSGTGNTLTIDVAVIGPTSSTDVSAFGFDIVISDPTVARYLPGSVSPGDALNPGPGRDIQALAAQHDDTVTVGIALTECCGVRIPAGQHVLTSLTFLILNPGTTTLTFTPRPVSAGYDSQANIINSIVFDSRASTILATDQPTAFLTSSTTDAADRVRLRQRSSTDDTVSVDVLIGGPSTSQEICGFALELFNDPEVAQYVAGSAVAGDALVPAAGQSLLLSAAQGESSVLVGIFLSACTGGGVPSGTRTIVTLKFQMRDRVTSAVVFAPPPDSAAFDNQARVIPSVVFDSFPAYLSLMGPDPDRDGIFSCDDNCPTVSNPGQLDADADASGDACDCAPGDSTTYPGAGQVCDAINNDCNHPSWPSIAGTNEADNDGDGVSTCLGDCDDARAEIWSRPGEVRDVHFLPDHETLAWSPPLDPGGTSTSVGYEVLTSEAPLGPGGPSTCNVTTAPGESFSSSMTPGVGKAFYYLVRAVNMCPFGRGTLGQDAIGVERAGCFGTYGSAAIGVGGGEVGLRDVGAISFGSGVFSSDQAVGLAQTVEPQTGIAFLDTSSIFGATLRLPYEVRIDTGPVCPQASFQVSIEVPPDFADQIPPGHRIELFARVFEDGGQEVLDSFELIPSTYDPHALRMTATLLPAHLSNRRRPDGDCEAILILAAAPTDPGALSQRGSVQIGPAGPSSVPAFDMVQPSTPSIEWSPFVPIPFDLAPTSCQAATIGPPLSGTLTVSSSFNPAAGHYGTDFVAANDSAVLAMTGGTVWAVGFDEQPLIAPDPRSGKLVKGWGQFVIIDHGGAKTLYGHLRKGSVMKQVGESVVKGEPIAASDDTGGSSRPHLHVEYAPNCMIYNTCAKIDPAPCINNSASGSVTLRDNGPLADDAFSIAINGVEVCTTSAGGANTCAINNLRPGSATLSLTVLLAPDDAGTFEIVLFDGLTFSDGTTLRSEVLPQGAVASFDIVIP